MMVVMSGIEISMLQASDWPEVKTISAEGIATGHATFGSTDALTRLKRESGRPGSNWHHQLGRLRFYH